jgi:ketosteroid isomerase-like protein
MRNGDLVTVERYLADDYFLIGVGGNTRDRSGRIGWLRENVHSLSTVTPTDLRIREYGDTAVVTGLVVIHDEMPPIYERFTHVWSREAGAWRMVSGQVTAVAPEHQPK